MHSVLIVNTSLTDEADHIGDAHIRLGNVSTAYSETNPIAKSGIVDGGFFELDPLLTGGGLRSGRYLTLRRDKKEGNERSFSIAEMRVY